VHPLVRAVLSKLRDGHFFWKGVYLRFELGVSESSKFNLKAKTEAMIDSPAWICMTSVHHIFGVGSLPGNEGNMDDIIF